MTTPQTIELFTAGCPLCVETLTVVQEAVADCGCQVVERRCTDTAWRDTAKDYGIRSVPTIVVDGQIVFEGRPSLDQAIALLRR